MSNQLSVSEVIESTDLIIDCCKKIDFNSSKGIFKSLHYDCHRVYVDSISSKSVGVLIRFYNKYEDNYEEYANLTLPISLYSEEHNEDAILSYLKELDLEYLKSNIETQLFSLACNIGAYKEFSMEVLKRINEGKDMSMYEHKQNAVEMFIDQYVKERLFLEDEV